MSVKKPYAQLVDFTCLWISSKHSQQLKCRNEQRGEAERSHCELSSDGKKGVRTAGAFRGRRLHLAHKNPLQINEAGA